MTQDPRYLGTTQGTRKIMDISLPDVQPELNHEPRTIYIFKPTSPLTVDPRKFGMCAELFGYIQNLYK
jgi:hypothetical protein